MKTVGAEDATIVNFYEEQNTQKNTLKVDMSGRMWQYRNKNSIQGIPVSQQAQDLPLNTFQQVMQALYIKYTAKVWTGYLSPDKQDIQSSKQYAQLKSKQLGNTIFVLNQERHFCASLNKVMIILTYTELSYQLHQRFKYLKQELKNE